MIRKLIESDRHSVLKYLEKEAAYNLFIIGDIENFGFDNDFQTLYAEVDDYHNYQSVLLFYRNNVVYYAHETRFNSDYIEIIKAHGFRFMSGKKVLMDLIEPLLENVQSRVSYFCEAHIKHQDTIDFSEVKVANTRERLGLVYDLLTSIEEFHTGFEPKGEFVDHHMSTQGQSSLTLYIEKEGKAISTVTTTAESNQSAMVVGVATDKAYRGQGYASLLLNKLLYEFNIKKHKSLCLFYDNPEAGKIYHKLGFETLGKWTMINKTS